MERLYQLNVFGRPVAPLTSAQLRALKTSNLSVPIFPLQLLCIDGCLSAYLSGSGIFQSERRGKERERSWIAPNGMQRSPVNLQPWGAEGVQGSMLYGELGLFGRTDISTWRRSSQARWICRKREKQGWRANRFGVWKEKQT